VSDGGDDDRVSCQICRQLTPRSDAFHGRILLSSVRDTIRRAHPDWSDDGWICAAHLHHFRSEYLREVLEEERGQLSAIERGVVESLKEYELLAANINEQFEGKLTLGERVADRVAEFGGSWRFIIAFAAIVVAWIAFNTIQLLARPFDPFPYILLNLVLSCLAAVQAPVIMMSQNRQEAKDRLRAEHDYRVNLKAELEVRLLHEKLDLLLTHQWEKLIEIQRIQLEMMEDLAAKLSRSRPS
jgi:uncharacterized membrane protein